MTTRRALPSGVVGLLAAALATGCANPSTPPGGPPDPVPPVVTGISPDSGTVGVRPRQVEFRFDEVVAERPARGQSLASIVFVSPYQGEPDVRWHRDRISIRLPGGWRDSTVYVVTLNPGVADLRGNVLDSTTTIVFSTGDAIPDTHLRGVVFDWAAGRAAPLSLVEALVPRGRDTTRYVARSDSTGSFVLPYVPAGAVLVRGLMDANSNFIVDRREAWDTTTVALHDSARVELYAFVHDTVGPGIAELTVRDSMTLHVALTRPLALDQRLDTGVATLLASDSTPVSLTSVLSLAASDSAAAARRDSVQRADSTRRADSTAAARAAAGDTVPLPPAAPPPAAPAPPPLDSAARDSVRADSIRRAPPRPSRPTPVSTIVIRTAAPLAPGARFRLTLGDLRGLDGPPRTSDRTFETPARDTTRPPTDSSAAPDSSATPDSAVAPGSAPPPAAPPDTGLGTAAMHPREAPRGYVYDIVYYRTPVPITLGAPPPRSGGDLGRPPPRTRLTGSRSGR